MEYLSMWDKMYKYFDKFGLKTSWQKRDFKDTFLLATSLGYIIDDAHTIHTMINGMLLIIEVHKNFDYTIYVVSESGKQYLKESDVYEPYVHQRAKELELMIEEECFVED